MKIERSKNSVRNTAFGIINRCINLLIPFVIRTILLKQIGEEFVGLNSLFTSVIQVLNLTELGVGSALVFSMYRPVAEDDLSTLRGLLDLYKKFYRGIGLAVLAMGLVLMPALPYLVDTDQLVGTGINLYLLFAVFLGNTVISYLFFAYRKSLLMAYQRQDLISNINSIVNLLMYSAQIALLFVVPNYYTYIMMMPLFTLLDNILVALLTKRMYRKILELRNVPEVSPKGIFEKVKDLVGHKVGAVIIQSANNLVISAFLNLQILTIYGNYFYVVSAINGFINVFYNAILSGVGNSLVTQSTQKNYQLFKDLTYLLFLMVSCCATCLLGLYQPFMELWMGKEYLFTLDTVILFVVYFYTWQIRVMNLNFKDAAGMWKNDRFKPYVGMVINVTLNILLVQWLGVNGVLIATIVVMVLVYAPWETIILHRDLFKEKSLGHFLRQLFYGGITCVACVIGWFVAPRIPGSGWMGLILKGIGVGAIGFGVPVLATCTTPEFKHIYQRVMRLWKRTVYK